MERMPGHFYRFSNHGYAPRRRFSRDRAGPH
jgi:hypothetical protein